MLLIGDQASRPGAAGTTGRFDRLVDQGAGHVSGLVKRSTRRVHLETMSAVRRVVRFDRGDQRLFNGLAITISVMTNVSSRSRWDLLLGGSKPR
jgi:hypothetical protein